MKFSREGKRFFLATVLIAAASLNTGNNLIYLIFSMMLSMLVLSVLILKVNISRLMLKVSHSQPIFANNPASIDITISNKKRTIPSYSIRILTSERAKGEAYFPKISGLSDMVKTIPVTYEKRGIYKCGDFLIESGFPFVFFSDRVLCGVDGEVIVYPEMRKIDETVLEIANKGFELSLPRMGKGDEIFMIREFKYGDDWRRIHWKASAKTAKIMITEYAAEESRKLTVILDNLRPDDTESFEKAVSFTASLADLFLNDGYFVRLLTCKKLIPFGTGREHLFKILDVLAVIQGQDSWECPMSTEPEGSTILVLNSKDSALNRFIPVSDLVIYAPTL